MSDVAFGGFRIAAGGGKLAVISGFAAPARLLIGGRLRAVTFRRLLVTVSGGALAVSGGSATQLRTLVCHRLCPVAFGGGRLSPPSRALPIYRRMTTIPSTLVELRRLRVRFDTYFPASIDDCAIVAAVCFSGVRFNAPVCISLGQVRSR